MSGKQNKFYFEESNLKEINRNKIPVVCVLGWAGARDQNLNKYAQIYSQLGFHTVRFSPSFKLAFFESSAEHLRVAYEFMSKLKDEYKLTENPLMFHLFSNACGFIIYQHVLNETTAQNKRGKSQFEFIARNQIGIVFDSSPGWPPMNEPFRFMQSVYGLLGSNGIKGNLFFKLSSQLKLLHHL